MNIFSTTLLEGGYRGLRKRETETHRFFQKIKITERTVFLTEFHYK